MLRRAAIITCLFLIPALAQAFADPGLHEQVSSSVVKVNAVRQDGSVSIGSAVVVAPEKLITNCHVLRQAREIKILQNGRSWRAQLGARDLEHDMCVLAAAGFDGLTARFGSSWEPGMGQAVFAAGYPGGNSFNVSAGLVKGLHDYHGGRLIQTSACFSPGASGGGLFDEEGRLLGILTFKAASGGDYHFVLPIEWVLKLIDEDVPLSAIGPSSKSFWEWDLSEQPFFLQAAALEEGRNWRGLLKVARKWTDAEGTRVEPWLAVGKACSRLKRQQEALAAFRRVVDLDPAQDEAQAELSAAINQGR